MKVYVIGIPSDAKDQQRAVRLFRGQGLDAQAFEGVDGHKANLNIETILSPFALFKSKFSKKRATHFDMPLNDPLGAIGCSLSHRAVWETILKTNEPYALICESDANPQATLSKRLEKAMNHSHLWDVVLMGYTPTNFYLKDSGTTVQPDGFRSGKMDTFGMHGYLISNKAAKVLLDHFHPMENQTDSYLTTLIYLEKLGVWYDTRRPVQSVKRQTTTQTGNGSHIPYCQGASVWTTREGKVLILSLIFVGCLLLVFIGLYLYKCHQKRS
jgi:GR25 family glycosyltransferase involved in LPS biosynthesis